VKSSIPTSIKEANYYVNAHLQLLKIYFDNTLSISQFVADSDGMVYWDRIKWNWLGDSSHLELNCWDNDSPLAPWSNS
jgi:hypothetical protein